MLDEIPSFLCPLYMVYFKSKSLLNLPLSKRLQKTGGIQILYITYSLLIYSVVLIQTSAVTDLFSVLPTQPMFLSASRLLHPMMKDNQQFSAVMQCKELEPIPAKILLPQDFSSLLKILYI